MSSCVRHEIEQEGGKTWQRRARSRAKWRRIVTVIQSVCVCICNICIYQPYKYTIDTHAYAVHPDIHIPAVFLHLSLVFSQVFHAFFQITADFFRQNIHTLNNSFIFFMGDHGFRFGEFRGTPVGAMEDNNPMLEVIYIITLVR
ncbi:unnamed protein product [Toxocara canis]|uniref:Sulfatase domain-containing protein n=1 Tax=Toxocara canis TaxID=6265 RepID=A0A183U6B2_TOXCA|nr:unnamed protein product [Toxocara canis]